MYARVMQSETDRRGLEYRVERRITKHYGWLVLGAHTVCTSK